MLSNTYVRIVCANENSRIRKLLERLWNKADKTAVMDGAASLYSLVEKIETARMARRFDKFILPFIKADDCGTIVLEKMESIRKDISVCVVLLLSILKETVDHGIIDRQVFVPEIKRYCDLNNKLLDYEESRLGVCGWDGVSEDNWFALAESFIKEDKELFNDKCLNEKEVLDIIPESSVWHGADLKSEYRL